MTRNNNLLLACLFIFSAILLYGVDGSDNVIFNLKLFILDIWRNLCARMGGTFGCFLDVLPPNLGGKGNSCITTGY
ncbi:unnamed protein product [Heterobilharzia americana]|nr:unnamed protein product [Heterobilharzia americana]CAH8583381.1 unnamed protein product [Heterobilharzia americana]